jgi:hypothetical protein
MEEVRELHRAFAECCVYQAANKIANQGIARKMP